MRPCAEQTRGDAGRGNEVTREVPVQTQRFYRGFPDRKTSILPDIRNSQGPIY